MAAVDLNTDIPYDWRRSLATWDRLNAENIYEFWVFLNTGWGDEATSLAYPVFFIKGVITLDIFSSLKKFYCWCCSLSSLAIWLSLLFSECENVTLVFYGWGKFLGLIIDFQFKAGLLFCSLLILSLNTTIESALAYLVFNFLDFVVCSLLNLELQTLPSAVFPFW